MLRLPTLVPTFLLVRSRYDLLTLVHPNYPRLYFYFGAIPAVIPFVGECWEAMGHDRGDGENKVFVDTMLKRLFAVTSTMNRAEWLSWAGQSGRRFQLVHQSATYKQSVLSHSWWTPCVNRKENVKLLVIRATDSEHVLNLAQNQLRERIAIVNPEASYLLQHQYSFGIVVW